MDDKAPIKCELSWRDLHNLIYTYFTDEVESCPRNAKAFIDVFFHKYKDPAYSVASGNRFMDDAWPSRLKVTEDPEEEPLQADICPSCEQPYGNLSCKDCRRLGFVSQEAREALLASEDYKSASHIKKIEFITALYLRETLGPLD